MRAKIHILLLLLSFSGLSFGQTVIYTNFPENFPDDFVNFISELYSFEEVKLTIEPLGNIKE